MSTDPTPLAFYGVQLAATPLVSAGGSGMLAGVTVGDVRAVVASQLDADGDVDRTALRTHHDIIMALAQSGAVLPAPFGAHFAGGERQARVWLRTNMTALCAQLSLVEGCVEFGFRVRLREATDTGVVAPLRPANDVGDVTALRRDRDEAATLKAAGARLETALSPLARAVHVHAKAGPDGRALVGGFLAPHERGDAAAAVLRACAWDLGDAAITLSGPWPPYSFGALAPGYSDPYAREGAA